MVGNSTSFLSNQTGPNVDVQLGEMALRQMFPSDRGHRGVVSTILTWRYDELKLLPPRRFQQSFSEPRIRGNTTSDAECFSPTTIQCLLGFSNDNVDHCFLKAGRNVSDPLTSQFRNGFVGARSAAERSSFSGRPG